MNLYVGNLNYGTTEDSLRSLFSSCGDVVSAKIIIDRDTGRSKGFGFVEMSEKAEGIKAISTFDGQEVDGRNIRVNEAQPRNGGGGGGGRGRNW
ncbi:MAG: RNA-binding protein [Spirochaetaceae bacterium]|nr:RNA-binding protein [Spirochaetaceae bacterium]|tara:strand:+ start:36077 stop:36358 length:282 start_codon:yes stop_codon:yes gene_type:complete